MSLLWACGLRSWMFCKQWIAANTSQQQAWLYVEQQFACFVCSWWKPHHTLRGTLFILESTIRHYQPFLTRINHTCSDAIISHRPTALSITINSLLTITTINHPPSSANTSTNHYEPEPTCSFDPQSFAAAPWDEQHHRWEQAARDRNGNKKGNNKNNSNISTWVWVTTNASICFNMVAVDNGS